MNYSTQLRGLSGFYNFCENNYLFNKDVKDVVDCVPKVEKEKEKEIEKSGKKIFYYKAPSEDDIQNSDGHTRKIIKKIADISLIFFRFIVLPVTLLGKWIVRSKFQFKPMPSQNTSTTQSATSLTQLSPDHSFNAVNNNSSIQQAISEPAIPAKKNASDSESVVKQIPTYENNNKQRIDNQPIESPAGIAVSEPILNSNPSQTNSREPANQENSSSQPTTKRVEVQANAGPQLPQNDVEKETANNSSSLYKKCQAAVENYGMVAAEAVAFIAPQIGVGQMLAGMGKFVAFCVSTVLGTAAKKAEAADILLGAVAAGGEAAAKLAADYVVNAVAEAAELAAKEAANNVFAAVALAAKAAAESAAADNVVAAVTLAAETAAETAAKAAANKAITAIVEAAKVAVEAAKATATDNVLTAITNAAENAARVAVETATDNVVNAIAKAAAEAAKAAAAQGLDWYEHLRQSDILNRLTESHQAALCTSSLNCQ